MHYRHKSQVLITTLIVMVIAFSIGAGFLFYSRASRAVSRIQVDTDKAYSLAKSGLERAIYCYENDFCGCNVDGTSATLPTGTYTIGVNTTNQDLGGGNFLITKTITSTGTSGRSRRSLDESLQGTASGWAKGYQFRTDYLWSLQQTADGGYILGGYTFMESGDYDFLVIKTDASGNVGAAYPGTWAKTYRGNGNDYLWSLQQTSDGGYILGGYTTSFSVVGIDFLVIKTDASGNVGAAYPGTWANTYGGSFVGGNDYLRSLQQTSDGGYVLGGVTDSFSFPAGDYKFLVIKTDDDGDVIANCDAGSTCWAKTYNRDDDDYLRSLQQTSDGGYILGGDTWSLGTQYYFLIKTDDDGDVIANCDAGSTCWAKTYGVGNVGNLSSLQQTSDGGYILGGSTWSGGTYDVHLIKTDDDGDVVANCDVGSTCWAKTYGHSDDYLYSLQQTSDGGYILGGNTFRPETGRDFLVIKTDDDGDVVANCDAGSTCWAKTYGGDGGDYLYSLQQTSDGYILGGDTSSFVVGGMALIKSDALGNVACCSIVKDLIPTVQNFPLSQQDNVAVDELEQFVIPNSRLVTVNSRSLTVTSVCPD